MSGQSYDMRITSQELEEYVGDLVASISVEGWGSLVDVEGFSDVSWEPIADQLGSGGLSIGPVCVV